MSTTTLGRQNRFQRSRSRAPMRISGSTVRSESRVPVRVGPSILKKVDNVSKKIRKIEASDPVFKGDVNTTITTTSLTSTPLYSLLNGIAQGDTQLTRDGVKVNWKSLKLTIDVSSQIAFAFGSALFRYIIIREESCLGSAPTTAQIFNSATPSPLAIYNFTNRDVPKRYKVYYDSGVQLLGPPVVDYTNVNGLSTALQHRRVFQHKIKFNFITDYSRGNAGTVADIDTNSLYLIAWTDNTTANAIQFHGSYTLVGHDN